MTESSNKYCMLSKIKNNKKDNLVSSYYHLHFYTTQLMNMLLLPSPY